MNKSHFLLATAFCFYITSVFADSSIASVEANSNANNIDSPMQLAQSAPPQQDGSITIDDTNTNGQQKTTIIDQGGNLKMLDPSEAQQSSPPSPEQSPAPSPGPTQEGIPPGQSSTGLQPGSPAQPGEPLQPGGPPEPGVQPELRPDAGQQPSMSPEIPVNPPQEIPPQLGS